MLAEKHTRTLRPSWEDNMEISPSARSEDKSCLQSGFEQVFAKLVFQMQQPRIHFGNGHASWIVVGLPLIDTL